MTKRIERETDPKIIETLKPNFIEDGCYTKDLMADEFERLMRLLPDSICVLVGYDDDFISGLLIAYVVDNRDYAYLAQAYSISKSDFAKEGFDMLIEWCKSLSLNELRYETERDSAQMIGTKRYGFSEHGVVMARKI